MIVVLTLWLWTLTAVAALGLAGAGIARVFQDDRPFAVLIAPICGILTLPLLTILVYSVGSVSFATAAAVAFVGLSVFTMVVLWRDGLRHQDVFASVAVVLALSLFTTLISLAATIANGEPTILFMDGTDHAGYAHVADWLIDHTATQLPTAMPDRPYQSWPEHMQRTDPRLSAFVLLAIAALFRGTSGFFAYDFACNIVLAVGILGLAAVFVRSRLSLTLLILMLALGAMFEYGRAGYFGKLAGYLSIFFLVGLFLTREWRDPRSIVAFFALVIGATSLHSALSTTLFLVATGSIFLFSTLIFERTPRSALEGKLFVLCGAALVAFGSNGAFARVAALPLNVTDRPWASILAGLMEVENATRDYVPFGSAQWLYTATIIVLVVQIGLIAISARRRDSKVLALLLAPLLVAAVFAALNRNWAVYQMAGSVSALSACAIGLLIDERSAFDRRMFATAIALALIALIIRLPRLGHPLDIYVLRPPPVNQYRLSELTQLQRLMRDRTVRVDIADPLHALIVLVELSARRGLEPQWSPSTWQVIVGYRHWPAPEYQAKPDAILVSRDESQTHVGPSRFELRTP